MLNKLADKIQEFWENNGGTAECIMYGILMVFILWFVTKLSL